jgi:hypothetical protein
MGKQNKVVKLTEKKVKTFGTIHKAPTMERF